MWTRHPDFLTIVSNSWEQPLYGVPMYRAVKKLKRLKHQLRILNKQHYDRIEHQFYEDKANLEKCQLDLHNSPSNSVVATKEREAARKFIDTKKAYQSYLFQRAKIRWLKEGDENTSYFHRAIKTRNFQ